VRCRCAAHHLSGRPSDEGFTVGSAAQPDFQALIKTNCATCHNSALPKPAGGLALDKQNVLTAAEHPEIWEKVIRKLRGRLMPPPGSPQPDQKDIDSLVGYLEHESR
jgi:mono/diheme cytochrome c family protein